MRIVFTHANRQESFTNIPTEDVWQMQYFIEHFDGEITIPNYDDIGGELLLTGEYLRRRISFYEDDEMSHAERHSYDPELLDDLLTEIYQMM